MAKKDIGRTHPPVDSKGFSPQTPENYNLVLKPDKLKDFICSLDPPPTFKEAHFLWNYFTNGFNQSRAAIEAYDVSESNGKKKALEKASWIGRGVLNKHRISIKTLLDLRGITKGKILDTLDSGLEAYKTSNSGEIEPDFNARYKYMDKALGLLGEDNVKNKASQSGNLQVNVFNTTTQQAGEFNKDFQKFLSERVSDQPIEGDTEE